MQQMHMGHAAALNGDKHAENTISTSVDDLITGAAKQAEAAADKEKKSEEKPKKDKSKARLVYSDNEISPEEKMARLARYAYVPAEETAVEEVPASTVVGTMRVDALGDPADA